MRSFPTNGIGFTVSGVEPNRRNTMACSSRNTPTEATTLPSGGAERNGRNTRRCSNRPSTTQNSSVNSSAGQNCMFGPNEMRVGIHGNGGRKRSPLPRNSA